MKPQLKLKKKAAESNTREIKDVDLAAQIAQMQINIVSVDKLLADPRNVRTHSKEQIASLAKTIQKVGWGPPLITHKGKIMAGHGRLEAAKLLGLKKVPTIDRSDMTEEQRRLFSIADNRLAELAGWDTSLLKDELALMSAENMDVTLTGFDMGFLDYKVKDSRITEEEDESTKEIFQLSNEVDFPTEGEMDLVALRKDRFLDLSKIKRVATWAGPGSEKRDADTWFYNFNSDSQQQMDWKSTLLGFYVDDVRFECWWNDTPTYVRRAMKQGIIGALSPNYSTYFADPKCVRLYNLYRSRFVGRYMQEAGIHIVPDISCGPDDVEILCAGLKGVKHIAMQAHQTYDKKSLPQKTKVIDFVMDELKPETILLYAPGDRLKLFPALKKARIILVEPRGAVRQRRIAASKQ